MSDLDKKISEEKYTEQENKNQAPANKSFAKELIAQLELIVIAFTVIILMFSFVARTSRVEGNSMENTMYNDEFLLVSSLFYSPQKEDIIVFHQTGAKFNEPIVKRVIGLPGDTVKIEYFSDTMKVTVTDKNGNSNVLEEDYMKYIDTPPFGYNDTVVYVEDGTVFVMGDNRNHSADSRNPYIGLVDQRRILGKVVLRLFPISRFGIVD